MNKVGSVLHLISVIRECRNNSRKLNVAEFRLYIGFIVKFFYGSSVHTLPLKVDEQPLRC